MEKVSILIVEDQHLIAEGIASLLRKHGIEVTMCESGEDALRIFPSVSPDLVLMDIQLKGDLDGIVTATRLLEKYSLPIIYLTDHTDPDTVARAKSTMPAVYLSKPFNEEDLLRHIDLAIANHRAHEKEKKNTLPISGMLIRTSSQQYVKLTPEDILYLEASRSYCHVITRKEKLTLSNSLNHVHEQLDQNRFMRVSRSYVVNLHLVEGLNGNMIQIGDKQVQMSKEYRDAFMATVKIIR